LSKKAAFLIKKFIKFIILKAFLLVISLIFSTVHYSVNLNDISWKL